MKESDPEILRSQIKNHFDAIAPEYDGYKVKASYYYDQVKRLLHELLPSAVHQNIVEIGCGTGTLLAHLRPARGLGIDISEKMIDIARKTWQDRADLSFVTGDAETIELEGTWHAVVMVDVLEHLYDKASAIRAVSKQMPEGCRLVITWANPIWSPVLEILEWLKLKMPEGPHHWDSLKTIRGLLIQNGLKIEQLGTRCLVPTRLPGADTVNGIFFRIPITSRLGLIRFLVCRKIA